MIGGLSGARPLGMMSAMGVAALPSDTPPPALPSAPPPPLTKKRVPTMPYVPPAAPTHKLDHEVRFFIFII